MGIPLRVLVVEDSDASAGQMMMQLSRAGYEPEHKRVQSAHAMTSALKSQSWDIVIANEFNPVFGAAEAIELVRRLGVSLPFIVLRPCH